MLDVRVLASGPAGARTGDATFTLVPPLRPRRLDGPLFYADAAVPRARASCATFRPDAVIAQSPYEAAAALARAHARALAARVVVEVHGDWRTLDAALRLPAARAARARSATASRRARSAAPTRSARSPATRPGSSRELGVEPAASFPGLHGPRAFPRAPPAPLPGAAGRALRRRARAVQERRRPRRRLAARRAAICPEARLQIVGTGTRTEVIERLVAELPGQATWDRELATPAVAAALDDASLPRAAVALRRAGPGRDRGVLPRPPRGRLACRRDPRPRRGRRQRPARRARRHRSPGRRARSACSPTATCWSDSRRERGQASSAWLATPEEYAARVRMLVEHA